ncbi:hypothetical protein DSM110093_01240 [Sulfitobacter sp. DSM 110093]|uniref:hypothetical protein n=1 Tax=Sulfitobacter sp. DSM 110093 TaxID=2883127 RepID=UPI001FAE34BC|nr:hypothetical protein [Sulfitobacter sp. DSM 110093]UOA31475.1 hypothetical protein DSM110093_01240 [Sulfitobacter sp. DSM 110093]
MLRPAFVTLALSLSAFLASPASAERCRAVVNGAEVVVEAENFANFADEVGTRERLMNWPARKWSNLWGTPPACNSGVLFDYLATSVPLDQINGYCLTATDENGYFLIPGERNYRGYCRKTFCERVNTTKEETVDIGKSIARSAVDTVSQPENLRAVAHKSGAFILTGGASALSANLATTGTTLATALSTPAALAATGVSVVAVGGAVYMCSGGEEVSSDD